jgi:hypothetical protein
MDILAIALFIGAVALFLIRAWKGHGRLAARDRWALLTNFAVAITAFAVAPLLINWVRVPTALWLTAVALLTGGVVGAVLRWPDVPWFSGKHPIRRTVGVGATLASCALIIGVAVT